MNNRIDGFIVLIMLIIGISGGALGITLLIGFIQHLFSLI